ncbi:MAG: trypsin-like peptidase domain-containing protein [Syntrophobacteraceae bacterium]
MKRNKGFRINNFMWPAAVFGVLAVAAIWINIDALTSGPLPSLSGQAAPNQPWAMNLSAQNQTGQAANVQTGNVPPPRTALQVQDAFSQVVAAARPSVVAITRTAGAQTAAPGAANGMMYLAPYSDGQNPVGSGIIVDRRGYILTTFQTVGKAKLVRVTLFSGTRSEYDADVVAVDPKTDLGLLKIRSNEVFPAAILANSDMIKVGDIVFAIGSPFGFSRTVTMGIVSSSRRQITINGIRYPDMIQTDAAINEGNDGGPLVNIKGEVIGINMATFMPDNHFSGIGFAIPISDAINFIDANI